MKILQPLLWILLVSCALADHEQLSEPQNARWYKGNLHTHSYWSDGDEFPEMIMSWYREHGYHFVALSDHNTLAAGDRWIEISNDSIYQEGFRNYLDKYGTNWVEYQKDSNGITVRLKTFIEYQPLFEVPGQFIVLQAEEITDRFQEKPLHLNAVNIEAPISPQGGASVVDVLQRNINAVIRQRDSLNQPVMVHINHPNFGFAITLEDMIALNGERFFEVFNGHPLVYNLGDSTHIDTETMWDQINIAYAQAGKPLLYGLATDDSHHYHTMGSTWSNSGRGWVQVMADTLSSEALLTSMDNGNFYASTGVALNNVSYQADSLFVEVLPESNIQYEIHFIGCTRTDQETRILKKVKGPVGSIKIGSEHLFIRAKITSNKKMQNPTENFLYEMAWTQPVVPN